MFQSQMQRPNQSLSLKKKNLINDCENIAYWEESERSEVSVAYSKKSWML